MTRPRVVTRTAVATAVSCLGWTAMTLMAPVAGAVPLGNGIDVECYKDSDAHVKCVTMGGCPRVNGDYVVDALHVMINGHQDEYPYHCINRQTAHWNLDIDPNSTFTFGVQACRKKDLQADWCTGWSNYTYAPPPPIQCPGGSVTPTVPAGQKCVPKPDVTLEVTPGAPLGGGTPKPPPAPPKAPPTQAGRTVLSDVDLYDVPGGSGTVIGQLKQGDAVTVSGQCPMRNQANPDDPTNGWCRVTDTTKNLSGAVWGEAISK